MISNIRGACAACLAALATLAAAEVPILEGLATYRFPVTTRVRDAQRLFDQGIVLAWGFHFAAAERSFREAARLDPQCAMCRWGIAYALGPSINHDPTPAQVAQAHRAVAEARALAPRASARERDLVAALAARYRDGPGGPRLDEDAYAGAMADAARRNPHDADLLTLHADALMTPRGREFWRRDGKPHPWTPAILAILERALRASPGHPGAHHLYVHALEDSPHPARALRSAEKLPAIAPGIGHLVHMPAHVYFHVGRYADAADANRRAIEADRRLREAFGEDPAYEAGYALHNHHFLYAAAMMSGQAARAREAALELARHAEAAATAPSPPGLLQQFAVLGLLAQVRFGRWEEILEAARPRPATPYTEGAWRFARALAFTRTGRRPEAADEMSHLAEAQRAAAASGASLKNANALSTLLGIARHIAEAEAAAAAGDPSSALEEARRAVALERSLQPDEPPAWPLPARHTLGALLLEAGRPAEAERVYLDDLRAHPANGWALAGLAASLERAGRKAAAASAWTRFRRAWSRADTPIERSRL